jgi:hypothetical protein
VYGDIHRGAGRALPATAMFTMGRSGSISPPFLADR